MTADDFFTELDLPIPGFEKIQPWIPKLNVAGDSENQTMAFQVRQWQGFLCPVHSDHFSKFFFIICLQAIVKRELSTRRISRTRRSLLQQKDRRRLEASIPSSAHRGLRMLCTNEVIDIDCPVNTTAEEFACVRLSDVRLDLTKIQNMISPTLKKLVNPANNGLFDEIAVPLEKLEQRLPGISDVAGVSIVTLYDLIPKYHQTHYAYFPCIILHRKKLPFSTLLRPW